MFAGCGLPFLYVGAMLFGIADPARAVVALIASGVFGVMLHLILELTSGGAASSLARATGLSGHGDRIAFEHSQLQALVAQGRVAEALEGYERALTAHPGDARLRLHVADTYARDGLDAGRAAQLFREGSQLLLSRRDARRGPAQEGVLYATQRLIDLYDGPLKEDGRALGELRRLIELFPESREANAARLALARRKQDRGL